MFANRVLLLSAAVGLLVGCGHDDRANAAPKAPANSSAAAAAPAVAPKRVAKPAAKHAAKSAVKPAAKAAAKPATKSTVKPATKSASSALTLKVPEAHLPPAGQCRIWKEGVSVFKQPQATGCDGIVATAPAGSMILERSSKDTKLVRVRYVDANRAGHVVRVRVFDAVTGKYVRDE
jgi:hypothetical protein